ncbi:DUF2779 domain-containing protein, partial [Candidatus Hodarchaeum mangrovi]
INLKDLDIIKARKETKRLIAQNKVIILYEPSIVLEKSYARIDILIKKGSDLELIEVKAKSIDSKNYSFITNKNYIRSKWKEYLYDVAYQAYLLKQIYPEYTINPYLMLVDSSKIATIPNLNQLIRINRNEDNHICIRLSKSEIREEDLGERILIKIPVKQYVELIWEGIDVDPTKANSEELKRFDERIKEYSSYVSENKKYLVKIGDKCKACEYRVLPQDLEEGKKSGFMECWKEALGWDDNAFQRPNIFDIWNYNQTQSLIDNKIFFIDDIDIKKLKLNKIQLVQIKTTQNNPSLKPFIHQDLKHVLSSFKFPYYFIDFETARFALPFNAGLHPYELIVFQFSIHKMKKDGSIEHYAEWIDRNIDKFPNFEFIRQLKKHLTPNEGTIFQYTNYEKNCLETIYYQLNNAQEYEEDAAELLDWIKVLINSQNFVDLCEIVKNNYYNPLQHGSFSIKQVIYAIVNSSQYLQSKYSQMYYGTNFPDGIRWIERESMSTFKNPYKLLAPLDINLKEIKEGGAAMIAYGELYFCDLSPIERQTLLGGLLRYCELDTLAMTMIIEYWLNPE